MYTAVRPACEERERERGRERERERERERGGGAVQSTCIEL